MFKKNKKYKMSVWVTLLLEKIAPLCPTLARKLRLVCKRFAENLPAQTQAYLKRREIYESPLNWPERVFLDYRPLYRKDDLNFDARGVDVLSFLQLVFPHILHEDYMQMLPIGRDSNGPVFECFWRYGMPIEEGPALFLNKCDSKECQLGCSYNTCFGGPRLRWAWSIRIDTVRMLLFISKVPIPPNYVKPHQKENPYSLPKRCKLC